MFRLCSYLTELRIDGDLCLKIADFGLSRDINELDYYRSRNKGAKIPIRWLAPESLAKGIYDTKSDVVSTHIILQAFFQVTLSKITVSLSRNLSKIFFLK